MASHEDEVITCTIFVMVIIAVFVMLVIGSLNNGSRKNIIKRMKADAVELGHAKWITASDGDTTFVWNKGNTNVPIPEFKYTIGDEWSKSY